MSHLDDLQLDRLIDDVLAEIANPAAPAHLEHRLKQRSLTMNLTPATGPALDNVLAFHSLGRTGGPALSRSSVAIAAALNIAAMLLLATEVRTHLAQPTLHLAEANIQAPPPPLPPARTLAGGGGGNPGPTPVSHGNPPRFAAEQLNPPKAPPLEQPKIRIDPTVDVQPDIHMANALPNLGMTNSPLVGSSLGNGRGIGLGSGSGAGVGPGVGGNFGGGIRHIGGSVSAPIVLFAPEPEFSEEARRAKVSGNVLVTLQVDAQGRPTHVRILRGIGLGLDQKAIEAVSQYKFKPALENGHPVPVEMNVEVNFQIF